MVFWLLSGVLASVVVAALTWGSRLLAHDGKPASREAILAIYRDQLAEIERDVATGSLSAVDAQTQRTEIDRRMLTVARQFAATASTTSNKALPLVMVLLVPVLALGVYLKSGMPEMSDVPRATRLANAIAAGDMPALVAQVEQHLESKPQDIEGWKLLASNYLTMQRYGDVATALARIIEISGPTAELLAGYAEAATFNDKGLMPTVAVNAVAEALKLDATHPKARYYNALGLAQAGKKAEALNAFEALLSASPANAPWRDTVEREISKLNADTTTQTPDEQAAMIRGMVDGLEQKLVANGNDLEGWLRLVRARSVLKEIEKAKQALATARQTFASDTPALASLSALEKELQLQ